MPSTNSKKHMVSPLGTKEIVNSSDLGNQSNSQNWIGDYDYSTPYKHHEEMAGCLSNGKDKHYSEIGVVGAANETDTSRSEWN